MTAAPTPNPSRSRLPEKLLSTCAIGAFVVVIAGSSQLGAVDLNTAFQATPNAPAGVTFERQFYNDVITTSTPKAVITWTPYDTTGTGPITFLPQGRTVEFQGAADFTVLNKVLPTDTTRPISLDGTITSTVGSQTGGNVWFYNPGGIIVGQDARITVGGLLLSANDIPLDGTGSFDANTVRFTGANGSQSEININSGAQILAGSYVALIAPRIVQAGSIRSDGQIAYIAAEKGTLTMPVGGLFSIQVDADGGSTVNDPTNGVYAIDHSGTTGGAADVGAGGQNHNIYIVTVAKNDAVTMLLGGTIGYDNAVSATSTGDSVVLSAGRGVGDGQAVLTGAPVSVPDANIQITNATITDALTASATGTAGLLAQDTGNGPGLLSLSGDSSVYADKTVSALAQQASTISTPGSLSLISSTFGRGSGVVAATATGGGAISIGLGLTLTAGMTLTAGEGIPDANGHRGYTGSSDFDGGTVALTADGGSIQIGTALQIHADGVAGVANSSAGGIAHGGDASIGVSNGGSITANNSGLIEASVGAGNGVVSAGAGSTGLGGSASIAVEDGSFTVGSVSLPQQFNVSADAYGGQGQAGGSATGGTATVEARNNGVISPGYLYLSAGGNGGGAQGTAGRGGDGTGGTATVSVAGGTLTTLNTVQLNADGLGGPTEGHNGFSGNGTGGNATVTVDIGTGTTPPASTLNVSFLSVNANGTGGSLQCYYLGCTGGNGGNGLGGNATVSLLTANSQVGFLSIGAAGQGGSGADSTSVAGVTPFDGGNGGSGTGGSAFLSMTGGSLTGGGVNVAADGNGGYAGSGQDESSTGTSGNGGLGGTGTGGGAQVTVASGSTFTVGSTGEILATANGTGNYGGSSSLVTGGNGGAGVGGTAIIETTGGTIITPTTEADATATGRDGGSHFQAGTPATTGGNATGGSTTIRAVSGVFNGGDATASATSTSGIGGFDSNSTSGNGGLAMGGMATISSSGATLQLNSATAKADAMGGSASFDFGPVVGGAAVGGSATIDANGGAITVANTAVVSAQGIGGDGVTTGGNGTGGTGTLQARNGGTLTATTGSLYADGSGGDGGDTGGDGIGGTVQIVGNNGALSGTNNGDEEATGVGGDGTSIAGGAGKGGSALITLTNGGSLTIATSDDDPTVGGVAYGAGGNSTNGRGGDAIGGTVSDTIDGGSLILTASSGTPTVAFDARALGGSGNSGGNATGGTASFRLANSSLDLGTGTFTLLASAEGGNALSGAAGSSTGGTITIAVGDLPAAPGLPFGPGGSISAGATTLTSTGSSVGGTVKIATNNGHITLGDTSIDTGGLIAGTIALSANGGGGTAMRFASLNTSSLGTPGSAPAFVLTADNARIAVTGDAEFRSTGDESLTGTNGGGLDVGGQLGLDSSGTISIAGGAEGDVVVTAGNFGLHSQSFTTTQSLIHVTDFANTITDGDTNIDALSAGSIELSTGGSLAAASLSAISSVDLLSTGSMTLGNVSTSATASRSDPGDPTSRITPYISLVSGATFSDSGGASFSSTDGLTVTGALSTAGTLAIGAGGNVSFAAGSSATAGNRLSIAAGNDILIGAGATVAGGQAPLDSGNALLELSAGSFATNPARPAGDISSIIVGGNLSSGAGTTTLSAQAVQVDGTIAAGNLSVGLAALPAGNDGSNDGGQLRAGCTAGSVCLGAFSVSGTTSIGQGGSLPGGISIPGDYPEGAFLIGPATGQASVLPTNVSIAGDYRGGSLLIASAGGVSLGQVEANHSFVGSGDIRVVAATDIDLLGSLSLSSDGTLGLRSGGAIAGTNAALSSVGNLGLTSSGDLTLASASAGGSLGGTDGTGAFSGAASIGGAAAISGTLSVGGGDVALDATGITIGSVQVADGHNIQLDAGSGALSVGTIAAPASGGIPSPDPGNSYGTADTIQLNGASISADKLAAKSLIQLTAPGAITVTTDIAAADVKAQGGSVALNAQGPLNVSLIDASAGDASVQTTGDLGVASAHATGSVNLASGGDLTAGGATADTGSITLAATGTATLNGAYQAATAIDVDPTLIVLNGSFRAPRLSFASDAVTIGGNAHIGYAGVTQSVSFVDTATGAAFVGGAGGNGYSLTGAGLARVETTDLSIALTGDTTIGDLSLTGSAAPTTGFVNVGGTLSITMPGAVQVKGALALTDAGTANGITLRAGPSIDVLTPTGSIAITDASGNPAGMLRMSADRIFVGSAAALADILGTTDVATRDSRLATNDGQASDTGYLVADGMQLGVGSGLYVQNSGATSTALSARRGLTVGNAGLNIVTNGQTVVIINGRQIATGGTTTTGDMLIPLVKLTSATDGTAIYDQGSTINGCRIVTVNCAVTPPPPPPRTPIAPPATLVQVRDYIDQVVTDGGPTGNVSDVQSASAQAGVNGSIQTFVLPVIQTTGLTPFTFAPPIDEPVTGSGNEDLWTTGGSR